MFGSLVIKEMKMKIWDSFKETNEFVGEIGGDMFKWFRKDYWVKPVLTFLYGIFVLTVVLCALIVPATIATSYGYPTLGMFLLAPGCLLAGYAVVWFLIFYSFVTGD